MGGFGDGLQIVRFGIGRFEDVGCPDDGNVADGHEVGAGVLMDLEQEGEQSVQTGVLSATELQNYFLSRSFHLVLFVGQGANGQQPGIEVVGNDRLGHFAVEALE